MKLLHHVFMAVVVVFLVGDIANIINNMSGNSQTNVGLQGADGLAALGVRVIGNAVRHAMKKAARSKSKKKSGGSEHTKNKRPSSKGKHEKGQSRKDRDQNRANGKKQKGGKDGSKKRPGGN